ncbi:hypothetical protein SSMOSELEY_3936 [Shigella sonnei str. Moseley]|nr:hypothetical protein SSMOSELEY_3936 [Shigella sonnei str. Moseley]
MALVAKEPGPWITELKNVVQPVWQSSPWQTSWHEQYGR